MMPRVYPDVPSCPDDECAANPNDMLTQAQVQEARTRAGAALDAAGIPITAQERADMEIVDFGLGMLDEIGLQIVVYVNTERVCAKEIVLFPHQTCAEHRHPPFDGTPGKEETFRVRTGVVYVHIEGEATPNPLAQPARADRGVYTAAREAVLGPGEQLTVPPNTRHWFQAGPDGAIVSEFSTTSRDDLDIFTDPDISRATVVEPARATTR
jgi:D-lyxose ketol-isomerase